MRVFPAQSALLSRPTSHGVKELLERKKRMPRRTVIEVVCDRCGRQEYRPEEESKTPRAGVTYLDEEGNKVAEAAFDTLCVHCAKAVLGYIKSVTKGMTKHSPKRGAKRKGPEAPSTAATPPTVPDAS